MESELLLFKCVDMKRYQFDAGKHDCICVGLYFLADFAAGDVGRNEFG